MQARSIILLGLGALLSVAFFKLLLDSRGALSPALSEQELVKALDEFERQESRDVTEEPRPAFGRGPATVSSRHPSAAMVSKRPPQIPEPRRSWPLASAVTKPQSRLVPEQDTPDLKTRMNAANRLYDRADYEAAIDAAYTILESEPDNARMKRIVVSSSCIMGDAEVASKYYVQLNAKDRDLMTRRCRRYGVEFDD